MLDLISSAGGCQAQVSTLTPSLPGQIGIFYVILILVSPLSPPVWESKR